MKNILRLLLTFGPLLITLISFSQGQNTLKLKSGDYKLELNTQEFIKDQDILADEIIENHYYRIISFSKTPTTEEKISLKLKGIELLDFLPEHSFYARIQLDADLSILAESNVISVVRIKRNFKLLKDLINEEYADWAIGSENELSLNLVFFSTVSKDYAKNAIEKTGATILSDIFPETMSVSVNLDSLEALYKLPFCYYFEFIDAPEVAEGYSDVANHRSSWLHNPMGSGTSYTGEGVTVMMQDDGPIGPHIDFEGRITLETTGNFGDHGDHVAGIIMGAGNKDEEVIGNAPAAHLLVYSSGNGNFGLVPELVDSSGLVITSKSYGDGNNAGYTSLARSLDEQCRDYDQLMHVFSAGNSGTSNFGYGAGSGWGNITGGHKQGKNVLAVGNLSSNDNLNNSSSRGPADDGRIKPDICAVGTSVNSTIDDHTYDIKSGTSMACPGVAGSLALLYEAYRDLNNGQNPSAALMNGVILNSADDMGNPGPDFKHGWGRINVRKAYEILKSQNYESSQISQNSVNAHTLVIPSNTKQVKIMIYWTDYQGNPSVSKALVNDLNMTATGPDGSFYEPLVLNPTPNPSLLDQDAEPGTDDLNNVEQIVIDNPIQGPYNLSIEGFDIPQGPQEYYLVYEIVQNDLVVTYPIGGESLKPGPMLLRWDAIGDDVNFSLDYTTDGGTNWEPIGGTVPADWRRYQWSVPSDLATGKVKFRVNRGSESVESEEFSIMERPENLNVEWACPNSFNFSWDSIPGAVAYEVYLLGEKYMDSAGYTITTNATVYANSLETQWVSVRAISADGGRSKRAIALEKSPGLSGCTLDDPIAIFSASCSETGPGSCVQFEDASTNAGQGAAWEWYFEGGTPQYSNQEKPRVCYENEGLFDVQLIVRNGVGEDSVMINQLITISQRESLPFSEDFEAAQLSDEWTFVNQGNSVWGLNADASAYGFGEGSFFFDNYSSANGAIMSFMTEQYDFTEEDVIYELQFDVSYALNGTQSDSLKVYATNDCGNTRYLLYNSGGSTLSTSDQTAPLFIPTKDEWRNESISLEEFTDWSSLSFIFEGESQGGNTVYVDNINVLVSRENFSDYLITTFPNPFSDELNIAGLIEGESTSIQVHNASGQLVYSNEVTATGGTQILNTANWADGVYVIKILSESKNHKTKLVKTDN